MRTIRVLLLLLLAIAISTGSVTTASTECSNKKIQVKVKPKKKIDYCTWIEKNPEKRCSKDKHKLRQKVALNKNGKQVIRWKKKSLDPKIDCGCACAGATTTEEPPPVAEEPKPNTDELDLNGCPFYDLIKDIPLNSRTNDVQCTEAWKVCDYSYVFNGCSFDDLSCLSSYTCSCMESGDSTKAWQCGHIQLDAMDCTPEEPRDPRDPLLLRFLEEAGSGLPAPGTACVPGEPLPKPPLDDTSSSSSTTTTEEFIAEENKEEAPCHRSLLRGDSEGVSSSSSSGCSETTSEPPAGEEPLLLIR